MTVVPIVVRIVAAAAWRGAGQDISHPVLTALTYKPRDPLAVTLAVEQPGAAGPRWVFAVDLLTRGMTEPAGEDAGLVQVMPLSADAIQVRALHVPATPGGRARQWRLIYPRDPLTEVLTAIAERMPDPATIRRRASAELTELAANVQEGRS